MSSVLCTKTAIRCMVDENWPRAGSGRMSKGWEALSVSGKVCAVRDYVRRLIPPSRIRTSFLSLIGHCS